jgi:hypothetical protein
MKIGDRVPVDGVPVGHTIRLSTNVDKTGVLLQIVDESVALAQVAFSNQEARKIAEALLSATGSAVQ